ncbi:Rha family transcriptional regulator [Solidesulfovibrio sp.]
MTIFSPVVTVIDGHPVVSSTEVAEHFQKQHKDVLKRIESLLQELPDEHKRNFALMFVSVEVGQGAVRQFPAYNLTRDGFTLLAMGFTGRKALAWKLRYIEAFNAMEAELSAGRDADASDALFLRRMARLNADARVALMRLAQRIEGRGAQRDAVLGCYRCLIEEITADMPDREALALPGDAPWAALIEDFLAQRCTVAPGLKVQAGKLYVAFENWTRGKGLTDPPSSIAFGRVLRRRFQQDKSKVFWWNGLGLTETVSQTTPAAAKGVMQ